MVQTRPGIAAIALAATAAVGSAQTQIQTESSERTVWDHNGSVMYLVANGASREFHYQKPRPGMLDAGVRPGSLLFPAKSTADNIRERHTFLTRIAGRSLSKLKDPASMAMSGLC